MDSKQFINIISQRLSIEPSTAQRLLQGFVEVIGEECGNLNRLALPQLGSFQGVKHEETIVRDLATGRRLILPPSIEVEFIPGGRLKNGISEGPAK